MREPNFSSPSQNRAAVVISASLYDRRALDCTATLPLVNSLTHLTYMTSTSPRIREILATDGGLERLVRILATCQQINRHSLWKWSLAFQCVVNVGVRGTESIRTRVVESGAVHVVLAILENFLQALESTKIEKDHEKKMSPPIHPMTTDLPSPMWSLQPPQSRSTPINTSRRLVSPSSVSAYGAPSTPLHTPPTTPRRRTFLTRSPSSKPKARTPSHNTVPLLSNLSTDAILHREEDILFSLQLLAYLSKYPHIRQAFHSNHRRNVFSVVEKFTHRLHPQTIIYWAGVIMRNACRKDESQGGVRQCAYMQCGKWERYPREFAKCRRCRKAKYCSKNCQSKAWAEGHRWWCVERPHSSQPPETSTTSTTTAAATAAVVAANPIPAQPLDQVLPLDNAATPTTVPIAIDGRESDIHGDSETSHGEEQPHSPTLEPTADIRSHNANHPHSRQTPLLFYPHRRRNSRSVRSLASGSSTEVEAEANGRHDMMEVD